MVVKRMRIELDLQGINELMKSEPVAQMLDRAGDRIAAAAGAGFVARRSPHKWVARTYVEADTFEAMRAEATDRVLTRSIDAGRG